MKLAGAAVLLAASAHAAESIAVELIKPEIIQQRLSAGVVKLKARQETISALFAQVGCAPEEQKVDKKNANVICTLPGETDDTIAVGGHFDFIEAGQGIVDDWSGVSLLPSLYQSLKSRKRRHTYIFIAFAAEERGLVGSARYVKLLTREQRGKMRAFINLECLGMTTARVWASRADPTLMLRAREIASVLQIPLSGMNVDRAGDDDTHPFIPARIPVLTFHSVTSDNLRILHSSRDRVSAILPETYYQAYKLSACYLAYLDTRLE